jgi:isoquinoline 1-oxidoreductase beta subunit
MGATVFLSRREFVKLTGAAGAGLALGVHLPGCRPDQPATEEPAFAPNAWVRIGTDGRITVVVDRSEMGQGVATALPMLVAEELEADWSKVEIEFAPSDPAYTNPLFGLQGTGGSTSVRAAWEPLRKAGAAAREMLIAAAAAEWSVDRSACRAENGLVRHTDGRTLPYGRLAARAATLPVPEQVTLKDPADFRIAGKAIPRLDTPAKVNGSAQFGIDVRLPGMLVAVVARSPVFGGKVARVDDAKAKAIPGVRHVVPISSGIAVVGDTYWHARQGRQALEIEWNEGPNAQQSSARISEQLRRLAQRGGAVARRSGDAGAALARAARRVSATYELPFLAHATMEPMNATAHVRADACDVWAPTQFQSGCTDAAAQITGLPKEKIAVHTTYLGGGFGRRFELDFVVEAVEVSKAAGVPVKVVWSREDDVQHDFFRPVSHHELVAGLDARGRPVAWTHRMVAPSIMARVFPNFVKNGLDPEAVEGAAELPYGIPNVRVDYVMAETGVPVGFWRSVNHSINGFVVESFIDELANAAQQDPLEYRRALLAGSPRHRRVLELAAEKAGWGSPAPAGRHRGIALHKSFESFVAQMAEVSVAGDGAVRVHRVVCAVDCGPVVNPNTVEAQMESGIVYGLTAALYGAITIKDGRAEQSNFHDYPMLRMYEMPEVEVHIVPSTDSQGGVGEPGTPPIAPAVSNAIFAATGKRLRRLPIGKVT